MRYPGKRPLLRLTARPPQLETPFTVFDESLVTPNDAFFVRYHLAGLPERIDPETFQLGIGGHVDRPLSLSLDDLKAMETHEVIAVLQCSGNSRGFFQPRVAGGQLGNGGMGNARWKGVPLKALLDRVGVKAGARQVTFDGLDGPVSPETPDFVKALNIDHARDGEVMVAYAMNGQPLPFLNGYPVRLIMPGFYGTYWVKHLNAITVTDHIFDGFWMKTAYRIPANECACTEPGQSATSTVPIGRLNVRSFITNVADGAGLQAGRIDLRGIAFDGGSGVARVEVSADGGASWVDTVLGEDFGPFSFRPWQTALTLKPGSHRLQVRATSKAGETQPKTPLWNPPGYRRNVIETVTVTAS